MRLHFNPPHSSHLEYSATTAPTRLFSSSSYWSSPAPELPIAAWSSPLYLYQRGWRPKNDLQQRFQGCRFPQRHAFTQDLNVEVSSEGSEQEKRYPLWRQELWQRARAFAAISFPFCGSLQQRQQLALSEQRQCESGIWTIPSDSSPLVQPSQGVGGYLTLGSTAFQLTLASVISGVCS